MDKSLQHLLPVPKWVNNSVNIYLAYQKTLIFVILVKFGTDFLCRKKISKNRPKSMDYRKICNFRQKWISFEMHQIDLKFQAIANILFVLITFQWLRSYRKLPVYSRKTCICIYITNKLVLFSCSFKISY